MTPDEADDRRTPADFRTAQENLFAAVGLDAESRFLELETPPVGTQVFESGPADGDPPMVFVHGSDGFGAFLAPLMAQFDDVHVVGFDRPGYGLSEPYAYAEGDFRGTVVDVVEQVVDDVGADRVDLVGHSMGAHTSIQYALRRPERVRRLVTVGAIPGFPGTAPPIQVRLLTVPVFGRLILRLQQPSREAVLDVAEIFGEREAMQDHPAFVDAIAAHVAESAETGFTEFNAVGSIRGWRPSIRLGEDELAALEPPTLVVWGDRDPLGTPDDVRDGVATIPDVRFETVDAGHIPYLAHAERIARFVEEHRGTE